VRELIWKEQHARCKRCEKKASRFWVHHKDGDATNDARGNLEALCETCHKQADAEVRTGHK
jgi:hypothetical protein